MAVSQRQLGAAMKRKRGSRTTMEMLLVHQAPKAGASTQTVAPGVRALPWERFVAEL